MPGKMTDSEAKVILESEYKFHGECSVFGEALEIAIQALKKQEKIKKAFEIWKFETGGYYCADNETISLIRTLKEILRSDDE